MHNLHKTDVCSILLCIYTYNIPESISPVESCLMSSGLSGERGEMGELILGLPSDPIAGHSQNSMIIFCYKKRIKVYQSHHFLGVEDYA